jgi:tRNA threonylcarbamoyladenosine biosynthesis protein TsaE
VQGLPILNLKKEMQILKSKSAEETKQFAKDLAKDFLNGGIIALSGDLGAGKTTFAQGFALGLGIEDKVISPTFLIIRQYPIPDQKNWFYHIDLYRLENIDLKNSGLEEILRDETNVVLIEWADKIEKDLPKAIKRIQLMKLDQDLHQITLQ